MGLSIAQRSQMQKMCLLLSVQTLARVGPRDSASAAAILPVKQHSREIEEPTKMLKVTGIFKKLSSLLTCPKPKTCWVGSISLLSSCISIESPRSSVCQCSDCGPRFELSRTNGTTLPTLAEIRDIVDASISGKTIGYLEETMIFACFYMFLISNILKVFPLKPILGDRNGAASSI